MSTVSEIFYYLEMVWEKSRSLYGRTTRQESVFVIQYFLESNSENKQKRIGEMAEWVKAPAWKACIVKGIKGSNLFSCYVSN